MVEGKSKLKRIEMAHADPDTHVVAQPRPSARYQVSSRDLAEWLRQQDDESWWSVDGDPLLMGRVSFPCSADDLAEALCKINKPLWVFDWSNEPRFLTDTVSSQQLDQLALQAGPDFRILTLCWVDSSQIEWLLVEDREIGRESFGVERQ
jgi:hypothetical protein